MESQENYAGTFTPAGPWSDSSWHVSQEFPQGSLYHDNMSQGNYSVSHGLGMNSFDLNNQYQCSYQPVEGHGSSVSYQVSALPPTAPRVHINPNYRPKAPILSKEDAGSNRHVSVHVNPHWKGRHDPVSFKDSRDQHNKSHESQKKKTIFINPRHEPQNKKTIYINPKILTQYKLSGVKSTPSELSSDDQKKNGSLGTIQSHAVSLGIPPEPFSREDHSNHARILEKPKFSESSHLRQHACDSSGNSSISSGSKAEPAFVVISSKKLIRGPNTSSASKKSSSSHGISLRSQQTSNLLPVAEKVCQRTLNVNSSPSLRIARQVSSKYKFVRNVSCPIGASRVAYVPPSDAHRRLRRKSSSTRASIVSLSKSAYKFVRKPGMNEVSSKLLRKARSNDSSSAYNSPKENNVFRGKGHRYTFKSLKTRHRLVKVQTPQSKTSAYLGSQRSRSVQSRYKVVHLRSCETKAPLRNVTDSQTHCVKSRFKILRNVSGSKVMFGRKVSGFSVTHTPGALKWRMKNSPIVGKQRKTHQSLTLGSPFIRRRGLYGNLIWKNEKYLLASQSKMEHSTVRKSKNGMQLWNKVSHKNFINAGELLLRSGRGSLVPEPCKERIVHIRGKKFILDAKGTTLRPHDDPIPNSSVHGKAPSIGRIDLGGVTFTKRKDNMFVRTNLHHARNILSNAKFRSIAFLTEKLRKNNQPCLIFHRFGKCHAHEDGKCWRVHDPKNIAICRKFLQGNCTSVDCLLSHNVGPEKMPTCRYFLEGCCVRDNCPYLHVKLGASATICRQFLHGYCASGDECKKRHVHLCPDFDQNGKCPKGKRCPYPHKRQQKEKFKSEVNYATKGKTSNCMEIPEVKIQSIQHSSRIEAEKRKRYYDENTADVNASHSSSSRIDPDPSMCCEPKCNDDTDDEMSEGTKKRPKLGILPAYIPLE